MSKKSDKHKCLDCNEMIDYRNLRCQTCWGKSIRVALPKCLDCKQQVSKYNVKRCFKCNKIWNRGKNHFMYGKKGILNFNYGKNHKGLNKGSKNGMYGKPTPHGKWIKYKGIKFRSSWEVAYAKYLTKKNIKWQYESKTFDLGNTTYTPDFYLPESDTYVEIKGWWRDDAKKKFKMFKKIYKIFIELITEKELKCLNLL